MRPLATLAIAACLVAGCAVASSPELDADVGPATDAGRDGGHGRDANRTAYDAGSDADRLSPDAGSSPTCTATCTSDALCATTCGDVPGGGIRCCDDSTQRCFVSHAAACPASRHDAGTDTTIDTNCVFAGSTEIAISVPGLAGGTVTLQTGGLWGPGAPSGTVTLDAAGLAVMHGPVLYIGSYYGNLSLLDATGFPVSFALSEGAASATVYPTCIAPDPGSLTPLDHVEVIVQRSLSTGLCAGSVLSVVAACVPLTGEYTPAMFDDAPCGPFR